MSPGSKYTFGDVTSNFPSQVAGEEEKMQLVMDHEDVLTEIVGGIEGEKRRAVEELLSELAENRTARKEDLTRYVCSLSRWYHHSHLHNGISILGLTPTLPHAGPT